MSVLAVGLLIVGLLVLIPQPVRGVQPGAPSITLADIGSSSDGKIRTTITSVVTIPQGNIIPLEYAEVIFADGNTGQDFGGDLSRIDDDVLQTCIGQISSWGGATPIFGSFGGNGYGIETGGYGYGYQFSTTAAPRLAGYDDENDNFGPGEGYGYGSETGDLRVTVTVVVDDCPATSHWGSLPLKLFHVQLVVGGGPLDAFASLPRTIQLRNPEAPAPSGTGAPSLQNVQITDGGASTGFALTLQAGGTFDGSDSITSGTSLTFTPPDTGLVVLESATISFGPGAVPEGATLNIEFNDFHTNDGAFPPAGATAFGIPGDTLGLRTGGAPFVGFISISMSGLPAGAQLGDYIDITFVINVPDSYFVDGRSAGQFHLVRYSDAGVFSDISCTQVSPKPAGVTKFSCTITSFSSFAMVSSAFGSGGGGGGAPTQTTSPSPTTTMTSTLSPSPSNTEGPNPSVSESSQPGDSKDRSYGWVITLVVLGLVAVLVGAAVLVRRKLK